MYCFMLAACGLSWPAVWSLVTMMETDIDLEPLWHSAVILFPHKFHIYLEKIQICQLFIIFASIHGSPTAENMFLWARGLNIPLNFAITISIITGIDDAGAQQTQRWEHILEGSRERQADFKCVMPIEG